MKLVKFSSKDCDGDQSNPTVTWQQYYNLRNCILSALRKFGKVGPMGECEITDAVKGPPMGTWHVESSNPDYFVIDDWYNNWAFYAKIEINGGKFDSEVVDSLILILKKMPPKWALGISFPQNGYILLYADRIMVDGPIFSHCKDYQDVLKSCSGLA